MYTQWQWSIRQSYLGSQPPWLRYTGEETALVTTPTLTQVRIKPLCITQYNKIQFKYQYHTIQYKYKYHIPEIKINITFYWLILCMYVACQFQFFLFKIWFSFFCYGTIQHSSSISSSTAVLRYYFLYCYNIRKTITKRKQSKKHKLCQTYIHYYYDSLI